MEVFRIAVILMTQSIVVSARSAGHLGALVGETVLEYWGQWGC